MAIAAMCDFCSRLVNLCSGGGGDNNVLGIEMSGAPGRSAPGEDGEKGGDGEDAAPGGEHAGDAAAPDGSGALDAPGEVPPEEKPLTRLIEFILPDGSSTFLVGHLSPLTGGYEI